MKTDNNKNLEDAFQEFFNFMNQEHDLVLTNTQIWDVINEVQKIIKINKGNTQKKLFVMRLIALPFKFFLQLIINLSLAFMVTFEWLLYGSSELIHGKGSKSSLAELIKTNENLIKQLKNENENKAQSAE